MSGGGMWREKIREKSKGRLKRDQNERENGESVERVGGSRMVMYHQVS
jgi:hypothetical protein